MLLSDLCGMPRTPRLHGRCGQFLRTRIGVVRQVLHSFVGVTLLAWPCGRYSRGFFNYFNRLGNAQLSVIRSIEVAVIQGFTYYRSLRKFDRDQCCWPLYRR